MKMVFIIFSINKIEYTLKDEMFCENMTCEGP